MVLHPNEDTKAKTISQVNLFFIRFNLKYLNSV